MKRITSTLVVLLTLCLTCLVMALPVSGQTISSGVSKGEIFDYSYSVIWSSTNPSEPPPQNLMELNSTQKLQFKVTDVSGTIITLDYIKYFNNGTNSVQTGTINLNSGAVTVPFGFLIISSNLNKEQLVYPNGGHQTITDTIMRSYLSGQRETNVILSQEPDETSTIYFDKVKGVAVEYSYQVSETFNSYTTTVNEVAVSLNSDVWIAVPPPPTPGPTSQLSSTPTSTQPDILISIAVLVAVIVVVVVIVLLLVKGRGRKKSRVDEEFSKYMKPQNS